MISDAGFVRLEVVLLQEADRIGGNDGRLAAGRQGDRGGNVAFLVRAPNTLQFDVVPSWKERRPEVQRALAVLFATVEERATDITLTRTRQRDQSVYILGSEPFTADCWNPALLAFEVGTAHEACRVLITRLGLAQQRDSRRLHAIAALLDAEIDPDDGLAPFA